MFGFVATLLPPLQLANRKAAAVTSRAGTRIRVMESPMGGVDRRNVSSTPDPVDRVPQLWQMSEMGTFLIC
jgi:hypothetical protein